MSLTRQLQERVFSNIHLGNLVYNTCWEDPRCDRELLQIGPDSHVMVLTSAGCNALDYLLDNPAQVHCVDMNPRQNALLELKIAFFNATDHYQLFDCFGTGGSPTNKVIYFDGGVRDQLPEGSYARRYWDKNINFFSGKGVRPSFYWHGTSGAFAWTLRQWFHANPTAMKLAKSMFEADTLEAQQAFYAQLEPRFLNGFVKWAFKQHVVQSMLGVPRSQQRLAGERFTDGMAGYARHCLRQVFMEQSLKDNYFWRLYFFGRYTPDCCPNYLRSEHHSVLSDRIDRVKTHTTTVSEFLKGATTPITHFILLDHQDWLASHHYAALEEEWRLIFEKAAPGAQILLRSASFEVDFLPKFVMDRVEWNHDAVANMHSKDRVSTYASTWTGVIK
jgi:S-adenosylmethionine-diacylglycerol 3-amino-3-carboxypropyl transferase